MARYPDIRYIQFDICGNPACKPELRNNKNPRPAHQAVTGKRRNIYIDPLAIGGIAVAIVMLVLMLVGFAQLGEAGQQAEQLAHQVEQLRQKNEELLQERAENVDLEELRWQAEALGLVPLEQVEHITVKAPIEEAEKSVEGWGQFYSFLAGLFA